MEATFWTSGIGIGMMSASGTRRSRKSGARSRRASMCSTDGQVGAAARRPRRAGAHTGMWPPFTRITSALDAIPMNASARPGYERFCHSVNSRSPYAHGQQRQPQRVDDPDPEPEQGLGPEPDDDRQEQERQEAEPDVGEVLEPPAQEQAEHEPERDTADQHPEIVGPGTGAVCRGRCA